MADAEDALLAQLIAVNRQFESMVPHNRALGLTVLELARGVATMKLPYAPQLVGNPTTGVLHGGAITALLDAACGTAAFVALDSMRPLATLDLRIDYLRAGDPGRDVIARAECVKVTRNVAFVRALAYHDSPSDPIAASTATFALDTTGPRPGQRGAK